MSSIERMHAFLVGIVVLFILSGMQTNIVEGKNGSFDGGIGTPNNPFIIEDVWDLQNMSSNLSAHYALKNDINASATITWNSGAGFAPIGTNQFKFNGSLDGRNHTIKGLFINRSTINGVGLFGFIDTGGIINNIGLLEYNVTGYLYVGGLVGYNKGIIFNSYTRGKPTVTTNYIGGLAGYNDGKINQSYTLGDVTGPDIVGGLVGYNYKGIVTNSYTMTNVTASIYNNAGGLVGKNDRGTISNSYANGNISGTNNIGGLVGFCSGTISKSYATGSVRGKEVVGGLIGSGGAVSNSYATGDVSGTRFIGGLAGTCSDPVTNSYAKGNVTGSGNTIGGLVGDSEGSINYCFATGYVKTGDYEAGGLVGDSRGSVNNSYSTGDVIGTENTIGGLVGYNYGTISNSYATGNVTGTYQVGGLVGWSSATVKNSYAMGSVIGKSYQVGGLIGFIDLGIVSSSYAIGNVSGISSVGGFVGNITTGTISSSFSIGNVSGTSSVGGFVGYIDGTVKDSYSRGTIIRSSGTNTFFGGFVGYNFKGKVCNCYSTGGVVYKGTTNPKDKGFAGGVNTGGSYKMIGNFWDKETSQQIGTSGNATGKTTAEMRIRITFINESWDFINIWCIREKITYPLLRWQDGGYPYANAGSDQTIDKDVLLTLDASESSDSLGITNYTWIFFDKAAQILYGVKPLYKFENYGIFTIVLNIRNTVGNVATDTLTIIVWDQISPLADAGPDQLVNDSTLISFNGSGSTDNAEIVNWTWSFFDDALVTLYGMCPLYRFIAPGMFVVTLNVTDAFWNWDTDIMIVIVKDVTPPKVDAGINQTTDEDLIMRFNCSASTDNDPNLIVTGIFEWTFIDNSIAITLYGVKPFYVFATPGVYTVILKLTDAAGNYGSDSVTITVRDVTRPRADTGPDQVVREDTVVTFDASGTEDNDPAFASTARYSWIFDDGGVTKTLVGIAPTYTFATPGRYVVTMTATDAASNEDTDDLVVLVLDRTPPAANASTDQMVDEDTYVQLDASASTDNDPEFPVGATYTWRFTADGQQVVLTGDRPGFTFRTPGTYVLDLNVSDAAGNSAVDTVTVTVRDRTAPVVDAGDDQTVDEDTAFNLDGSGTIDNHPSFPAGATYAWSWTEAGAPRTASGATTSTTIPTPGVYVVTLTVTDAAGNAGRGTVIVTVRDKTAPTVSAEDVTTDEDVPVVLDASATTDNDPAFPLGASFVWSFSDNGRDVRLYGPTPLYIFMAPGAYDLNLTVRDAAANSGWKHVKVTVRDLTAPVADAGPDVEVDQGDTVSLTASASRDDAIDWPAGATVSWLVHDADEDRTYAGALASHTFETVGSFVIELTVTDRAGFSSKDTMTVKVRDSTPPVIDTVALGPFDEDTMVTLNLRPFVSDNDPEFLATGSVDWALTDPAGKLFELSGLAPVIELTTPGTWRAHIVVSDASGNSAEEDFFVVVNDRTPPVARANAHPAGVDEDTTVSWDATSSTDNDPKFPDGANLTWAFAQQGIKPPGVYLRHGARVDFLFQTPGIYLVTLTINDTGGNVGTWTELLVVRDTTRPILRAPDDLVVAEDVIVSFDPVEADDNDPAFPTGAAYTWNLVGLLGGSFTLRGVAPSFIFATPDLYSATVEVADAAGNVGTAVFNITVRDTTAPGTASDLRIKGGASKKAVITWTAPDNPDLAGFIILRQVGDGQWIDVANLSGANVLSYTDRNLSMGRAYRYKIEAYDTSNNIGAPGELMFQPVEPAKEGYFPWWLSVIAFVIGLVVALIVDRMRSHK